MTPPPDCLAPLAAALLLLMLSTAAGCGPARQTDSPPPVARGTALPPPGLALPPGR
jgi:hypothetical protein